ncbi:hypothetical protein H0H81_007971, partial [Sphagnurus paluster]
MCPDRKLEWFHNRGWDQTAVDEVCQLVVDRWNESYRPSSAPAPAPIISQTTSRPAQHGARWLSSTSATLTLPHNFNDIETYLTEPVIPTEVLEAGGGVMAYWDRVWASQPNVARMGLDICSAPASSVDAERAFLGGQREVNHLQHNMSSQTFKADMAVGSWI